MVGVDVFVSELRALLLPDLLGPSSVAFIVDGNGDVVYHESLFNIDVGDYAQRVNGLTQIDFIYLWSKPSGNGTVLEV